MRALNFTPFPVLTTERLLLREITPDDAGALFQLRTDKRSMRYIGKKIPSSLNEIFKLITVLREGITLNTAITWAICFKDDPKLIGTIGYHLIYKEHSRAEIGYMLLSSVWQQGIISEAIPAVLQYGFHEMELHSVEAKIDPENKASSACLKKFNFIGEGYFKESFFFEGKFMDTQVYSLLQNNYKK